LIPVAFDAVDETHIQALVDTGRAEDRYIDFKRDWNDADFDKLAADVCAFANTDGGDVVVGVADTDRIATKVLGVECDQVDRKIRQIEEGIRPRIEPAAAFRIREIPRAAGPGAFVLRVPASPAAPHRVISKGIFYSRGSAGNREMDIFQVREAFLRGTLAEERIREFRRQRIATLENTDFRLQTRFVWALFQVISVPAMMRATRLLSGEELSESALSLRIFGETPSAGAARLFNLDGLRKGRDRAYVQIFRDGKLESRLYLGQINTHVTAPPAEQVQLPIVRNGVRSALRDYVKCLEELGFPAPYSASLTLANVEQVSFATDTAFVRADRAVLEIPEALVADTQASSIGSASKQITDMLYQAFGYSATEG
jgi:hypothetical protein